MKGIFITIEGPDGAGKTTVINQLVPLLIKKAQTAVMQTREPGGSRIAEAIREIILTPVYTEMDARTEALLYTAARRQHIVETLLPALSEGKMVLCDRFVDSSLAYQGGGRHIGVSEVAKMNEFATEGLQPDLTLYLDIDAKVGIQRIMSNRADEINRLDQEKISFHETVREVYLDLYHKNTNRITLIDADQPIDQVVEACQKAITQKFPAYF